MGNSKEWDSNQESAWYVIRTPATQESTTKTRMIDRLRTRQLIQLGMQIVVPKEILANSQEAEKYTGFILVRMHLQHEIWKTISNTPGVTGYVGMGTMPTAFPEIDWTEIPFDRFSHM